MNYYRAIAENMCSWYGNPHPGNKTCPLEAPARKLIDIIIANVNISRPPGLREALQKMEDALNG